MNVVRRSITVRGIVQGVGFRPFVHGLAERHGLSGFVRNRGGDVDIEVEGTAQALRLFEDALRAEAPPLAVVDDVTRQTVPTVGAPGFHVIASADASTSSVAFASDTATCAACVRELFDPNDRRFRYPFLNCTDCGPRLTIVSGAPYDRARTSMATFAMCEACRAEYEDPRDRRFHAQPIACASCGPQLVLRDPSGNVRDAHDPLGSFVAELRAGRIGGVKGLGGWHLVCAADRSDSVAELRARKQRDDKPFAVMVRDLDAARAIADISPAEASLLESSERPIVLVIRRMEGEALAGIAPDLDRIGIMLPYTPVHHLLLGMWGDAPLVMTSGNRSDEPIAYATEDWHAQLTGIADVFLDHDRPILTRCDDSVARVVAGAPVYLRRARGLAPRALRISSGAMLALPTLAVGGHQKAVFALGEGARAILGHHIGDLDHFAADRAWQEALERYFDLFRFAPARVVCDRHPDYASTRHAQRIAATAGIPLVTVQHHRAHVAATVAEHGAKDPVIGVAFDGSGYGDDDTIWGGEVFVGELASLRRVGHLRAVPLPGGEAAIREPWRMAVSHALDAGLDIERFAALHGARIDDRLASVSRMIARRINAPLTSSVGRLFDAVAALVGLTAHARYEAQGPMQLEALAGEPSAVAPYSLPIVGSADAFELDSRPLFRELAADLERDADLVLIARRFHEGVAAAIADACEHVRAANGIGTVALGGGVFANGVLLASAGARLAEKGFRVLRPMLVPPNDGGLAFGQLALVAAADTRARANGTGVS